MNENTTHHHTPGGGVSAETPRAERPCLIAAALTGLGLIEGFLPHRQRRPFTLALGVARTLVACAPCTPKAADRHADPHGSD